MAVPKPKRLRLNFGTAYSVFYLLMILKDSLPFGSSMIII